MADGGPRHTAAGLAELLRTGRLLPVQVQLAAALGCRAASAIGLATLDLGLLGTLRRPNIHQGLPRDVVRVLRAATRSSEYGLPPQLSVTWGADCAERALPVFEAAAPGDDRPRQAIEAARACVRGQADAAACSAAASGANDAIEAARLAAESGGAKAGRHSLIGVLHDAEAAAYVAREVAGAVAGGWVASREAPSWFLSDNAACHAGHAANLAALVAPNRSAEHWWQRERLVNLILSWDSWDWWPAAEDAPGAAAVGADEPGEVVVRTDLQGQPSGRVVAGVLVVLPVVGFLFWLLLHGLGRYRLPVAAGVAVVVCGVALLACLSRSALLELRVGPQGLAVVRRSGVQEWAWGELEAAFLDEYVCGPRCFRFRADGVNREVLLSALDLADEPRLVPTLRRHLRVQRVPQWSPAMRTRANEFGRFAAWVFVLSACATLGAHALAYHTLGTVFGLALMAAGAGMAFIARRERPSRHVLAATVALVVVGGLALWAGGVNVRAALERWELRERRLGRPPWGTHDMPQRPTPPGAGRQGGIPNRGSQTRGQWLHASIGPRRWPSRDRELYRPCPSPTSESPAGRETRGH